MKVLMSIKETAASLSVGPTTTWALIKANRLDVVRIGRRTLVKTESIDRLINGA